MTRVLSADWVLPVEGEPIERGAVAVEDGRIAAVGTIEELGAGEHHAESAIVPAFVNAHTHLEYAVYAGFGDGYSFGPWISLHVARKQRLERTDMEAVARLGAAECLRSGIGTVGDLAFSGASAHACAALGLRAIVYLEVFGREGDDALRQFEAKQAYVAPALSDRVGLGVSSARAVHLLGGGVRRLPRPRPPRRDTPEREPGRARLAPARRGPWQERARTARRAGRAERHPPARSAGLLDGRVVAAHCVKVDEEEIALLAEHGVAVAHCPRSNALLGCGVAPLRTLRATGLRVGVGTDGVSSVPSHDFFDELRAVVALSRAREEAGGALLAAEALELGTLGGARALGLEADTGSLVPGKRADLAVVSLSGSPYLPWEDPAAAVVFGGSPGRILATLVDGETRYERGGHSSGTS